MSSARENPTTGAAMASPLPPTKPSAILYAAAALLEPKGRWTKLYYATKDGKEVFPPRKDADCFCMLGAGFIASGMESIADFEESPAYEYIGRVLPKRAQGGFAHSWNDATRRKQADVVAMLRKAADLARSEGQ